MNINIANLVTFFRLALVPGVILCFFSDLALANYWAALLFTIASLSDWLDGYLARSMGLPSISLPLLTGSNNLPLGIQLIGDKLDDLRFLGVANWLEKNCKKYAK